MKDKAMMIRALTVSLLFAVLAAPAYAQDSNLKMIFAAHSAAAIRAIFLKILILIRIAPAAAVEI